MVEMKNTNPNGRHLSGNGAGHGGPRSASPRAMHREADSATPSITPGLVLDALRRWWRITIPLGLILGISAAALVYASFKPTYRAAAWLRIADSRPYIAFNSREDSRSFVSTQVELIRSPLVLGPVVSHPEIARLPELAVRQDPIAWLGDQMEVRGIGRSELFHIAFSGPDPGHSAKIVNAVVESFFQLRGQQDAEQMQRVIQLLEEERDRRSGEVKRMREEVRELTKQLTGKDPYLVENEPQRRMEHPLANLQTKLTNAEVEREILAARVRAFEESASQAPIALSAAEVEQAVDAHDRVRMLKESLLVQTLSLQEYESKLVRGKDDPSYRRLATQVQQEEALLERTKAELRKQLRVEMESQLAGRRQETLAKMKSELETYRLMADMLKERCDSQVQDVQQVSGDTVELGFKRSELERAEQVLELITARVVKLRTEQRAPERISLLQEAKPPMAPVEVLPYKKMAMVLFAGLCVPFGLAVAWERFVQRVSTPEQLERQSHLPVMGEVARLPSRSRNGHAEARTPEMAMLQESIDSLRTCLVLSEQLAAMRVLAVTSGVKGEGKTSVATQLAVSLSRASGKRTLLVDGDMRSPDVHRLLGLSVSPGLAEVLQGEHSTKDAINTQWHDLVDVLPGGKLASSPHKLLGNGEWTALLDELQQDYDYIVIDTPPILAASEAAVLTRLADATLVCAMRDVSRIDQIRKTHHRLLSVGARPVGVVLNGVSLRQYAYRYGNYYNAVK